MIRAGGLVAFPTETVYGLGADAMNVHAVRRIYEAKGRPADNPLIVHIAEVGELRTLAASVTPTGQAIIDRFFPGPVTVVLQRASGVDDAVTAGLPTVAVRMPTSGVTRAFLRACGTPVAAPSANRSGRPSPTTWQDVLSDLDGRIECVLQGPQTEHGLESTVVDCTGSIPVVLRTGAVPVETLRTVVPELQVADERHGGIARSPGTRHRHYAPDAEVVLVDAPPRPREIRSRDAYIGLDAPPDEAEFHEMLVCSSLEQYAFELFHFFRTCEKRGAERIFCQRVTDEGLGRTIMDRLNRAAQAGSVSTD